MIFMCARYEAPQELWKPRTMSEEFEYDLTPSQWDALKALRTPASKSQRLSRYAIEGLVALELATMDGDTPLLTATGRKVLIRGSSRLLQDLAA
jgi:hypothetical protein